MRKKGEAMDEDQELGKRLLAALLSYQADTSMDYYKRRYLAGRIDDAWEGLARELLRGILTGAVPTKGWRMP